jgi:hypothetical protein
MSEAAVATVPPPPHPPRRLSHAPPPPPPPQPLECSPESLTFAVTSEKTAIAQLHVHNTNRNHALAFKIKLSSKLVELLEVTPSRGVLWLEDAAALSVQTTPRCAEELRRGGAALAGQLQALSLTLTAEQTSTLRASSSSASRRQNLDAIWASDGERACSRVIGCSIEGELSGETT